MIAERNAQKRESLKAVDDEVAVIVAKLAALDVLDDTYIVFASDNGYMDGQHRVARGKAMAYDAASRVPLMIRGAGFPVGAAYDRVTGLQDLAPTILDVTGETPTGPIDGVSMLRLANGSLHTNRPQLIEIPVTAAMSDNAVQAGKRPTAAEAAKLRSVAWNARGIVESNGWKYVEYPRSDDAELYNLDADPFELDNLANDSEYARRVARMSSRLHAWQSCAGVARR